MLLPGGLVVYFAFNAGGFFPMSQDLAAVLLGTLVITILAIDGRRVVARNRPLAAATLCFAAYAAWVLVSVCWSHAPLRATSDFNLTLLYFLAFVLYSRCVTGPRRMRWLLRGLALGSFFVCLVALVSRTLPSDWPIQSALDTPRLSYPVTYWNTLGLLAALGAILCLGLASDEREPRALKALSALAVPVFGATLLLTFSRGAMAAGAVGVVAYILAARQRSLFGALFSIVPTAAVAIHAAYEATALAANVPTGPAAVAQGRHLAFVVAVCCLTAASARYALASADSRFIASAWQMPLSRRARRLIAGAAMVGAGTAVLAAGLPHSVAQEYDRFVRGNTEPRFVDARDRLGNAGADGRIDLWRVAVKQFNRAPVRGTGAGTFALAWEMDRPSYEPVVNTHSLYLENLGDVGIVGLALLVAVLLSSLVAIARRVRGPSRGLYAAALAVALTWIVRAGVDWDWQMPVVSLPAFVVAGAAFAPALPSRALDPRVVTRGLLGLGTLALAVFAFLAATSESHFTSSLNSFEENDCPKAKVQAHASLTMLSFRPDAHEILAFCEVAENEDQAALLDATRAVDEDPQNWEPRYGLAVVEAATGGDPRQAMAKARALNPKDPVLAFAVRFFSYRLRPYWRDEAALDLLQVGGQGDRNLKELGYQPPAPTAGT